MLYGASSARVVFKMWKSQAVTETCPRCCVAVCSRCCQCHSLGSPAAVSVLRCSGDGERSGTLLVRGRLGRELCAVLGGAGPWRADAGPISFRLACMEVLPGCLEDQRFCFLLHRGIYMASGGLGDFLLICRILFVIFFCRVKW